MSRVGLKPIVIPKNVKINQKGSVLEVEGAKGKLKVEIHPRMKVNISGEQITIERKSNLKYERSLHGMTRSLIQNAILGVDEEYTRELSIEGVGFRAQASAKSVNFSLGFSHPIEFQIPEGVKIKTPKPTQIVVSGIDKYLVGQVAANIRSFYEPEPYKGKGVRYKEEQVRRKQGKSVG